MKIIPTAPFVQQTVILGFGIFNNFEIWFLNFLARNSNLQFNLFFVFEF
jgi:hypothetical protein